jgi:hypothetical protein
LKNTHRPGTRTGYVLSFPHSCPASRRLLSCRHWWRSFERCIDTACARVQRASVHMVLMWYETVCDAREPLPRYVLRETRALGRHIALPCAWTWGGGEEK